MSMHNSMCRTQIDADSWICLQTPMAEALAIVHRRFPVPRLVDCDQNGSQVRTLGPSSHGGVLPRMWATLILWCSGLQRTICVRMRWPQG